MTDPRMLRASLAGARLQVVTLEPGARKCFPSPPQRFPTPPHQNPSPRQRNPSWTQRNQNGFSFRNSTLFKGLRRCFRPFSLRRSFVALSTRPLVRALLMVIAIARILFFVKKMPLNNFSERPEPREPKRPAWAQPGFWFRIKSSARVFSNRRKFPANQNGRRGV